MYVFVVYIIILVYSIYIVYTSIHFSVHVYIPYSGNHSREKTFANWWENGISLRKLSWIARLYRLNTVRSTEPSNTCVEN